MENHWNNVGPGMYNRNPMDCWQQPPMFPPPPTPPMQYFPRQPPPQHQQWMRFQGCPWQMPPEQYNQRPMHSNRPRFSNNNNNNGKNKQRNRKEPEFIDFCDVCDRGFKNIAKKIEHYKQHVKCDEPGCKFEAHFKIVAIHKQNLHGPNALKIKLETPEEILKWRSDRKRNYPSAANVELKLKKSVERQKIGNVIENKTFGNMRKRKRWNKSSPTGNTGTTQCDKSQKVEDCDKKAINFLMDNSVDVGKDSDSDEGSNKDAITAVNVKANMSVGLGSLMQNYASDTDEEKSPNKASDGVTDPKTAASDLSTTTVEKVSSNGTSHPGRSNQNTFNGKHRVKDSNSMRNNQLKRKRKNLLEMLLAPDIRKERNQILQCVRFIVLNNFFDNGESAL